MTSQLQKAKSFANYMFRVNRSSYLTSGTQEVPRRSERREPKLSLRAAGLFPNRMDTRTENIRLSPS